MSLPVVSSKEVVKALGKSGFKIVGQKGSHVRMKRPRMSVSDHIRIVIVPMHGELAKGTLRHILNRAGLTVEEFLKLLSS